MQTSSANDPHFINQITQEKFKHDEERHQIHSFLGKTDKQSAAVQMQSNDYLSIARDRRISQSKASYLLSHGHGDAISRIFAHDRQDIHRNFERRIAQLTQAEDAVLVMSGYNANTGIVQAFAQPENPVYIDIRAHASLWEGILCARAKARPFRHNQVEDLKKKLIATDPALSSLIHCTAPAARLRRWPIS